MAKISTEKQTSKIEKHLERLYQTALEQENTLDFFKGINAYAEYVLGTPILKAVVDEQMAERAERYEKLELAEKTAVEEMLVSKERLFAIIKEKGVKTSDFVRHSTFAHEPFTDIVVELGAYERGEIIKGELRKKCMTAYCVSIKKSSPKYWDRCKTTRMQTNSSI